MLDAAIPSQPEFPYQPSASVPPTIDGETKYADSTSRDETKYANDEVLSETNTACGETKYANADKNDHWSKWVWDDLLTDLPLSMCSLAAQGLWIRMLGYMFKSERRGYLQVAGRSVQPRDLARLTGETPSRINRLMDELELNEVFSRDDDGIIYCRRMVRETRQRAAGRENGKLGGNPTLKTDRSQNAAKRSTQKGLTPDLELESELELEREGKPSLYARAARGDGSTRHSEFDQFYAAYPRKRAKGDAERAFNAAVKSGTPASVIIAGLARHQFTDRPDRVPYPATWLRARQWEDEPEQHWEERRSPATSGFKNPFLAASAEARRRAQANQPPVYEHKSDQELAMIALLGGEVLHVGN